MITTCQVVFNYSSNFNNIVIFFFYNTHTFKCPYLCKKKKKIAKACTVKKSPKIERKEFKKKYLI